MYYFPQRMGMIKINSRRGVFPHLLAFPQRRGSYGADFFRYLHEQYNFITLEIVLETIKTKLPPPDGWRVKLTGN
jgi:hypothetical protein